jgi:hypothetical protein
MNTNGWAFWQVEGAGATVTTREAVRTEFLAPGRAST